LRVTRPNQMESILPKIMSNVMILWNSCKRYETKYSEFHTSKWLVWRY
jgi:hypothetical protein